MTEIAATPDNFSAHLAAADDAMDAGDTGDQGQQPANDNNKPWTSPQQARGQQDQVEHVNPERRVMGDGDENTFDPNAAHQEFTDDAEGAEGEPEADQETQQGAPEYEELQKMYQILEGPELPPGLYDKRIPIPGTNSSKSIQELVEGNMRMSDYSRKSQEASQAVRQAQQVLQNNAKLIEGWKNPKILRATLEKLGLMESFHAATSDYATEQLQFARMTPEQRQHHTEIRELERRKQAALEQAQRAEQQVPKTNPYHAPIEQHLRNTLPQVWGQLGIRESPVAVQHFAQHIQAVWDGQPETMDRAILMASQATAEDLQWMAQHHFQGQQMPANTNGQAPQPRQLPRGELSPRPAPGGGGPRQPQNGKRDNRYRSSNFGDFLDSLKGQR